MLSIGFLPGCLSCAGWVGLAMPGLVCLSLSIAFGWFALLALPCLVLLYSGSLSGVWISIAVGVGLLLCVCVCARFCLRMLI